MARGHRRFHHRDYDVARLQRAARLSASRGRQLDEALARVAELGKLLGRWRKRYQRLAKKVKAFVEGVAVGGFVVVERGR
jgi:hypothetical protein